MPLLTFRNYLAASRKPNMINFGLYRAEAGSDLAVIEENSATPLPVTGTQDGVNRAFIIPGPLGSLYLNGLRQAVGIDFTITTGGFTMTIPPRATDLFLAFSTGAT